MSKKIFLLSFLILYFIFNPKILPSVNARGADGKCTTDAECQEDIRNAEAMLNKLAKEKEVHYEKGFFDYFNSNENNPLYKKEGFEITQILQKDSDYITSNIKISLITQKKVTQQLNPA